MMKSMIPQDQGAVIFVATRHHVEFLQDLLRVADVSAAAVYGTMDQTARKLNLARFRNNQARALLVTDVAARGLDIPQLDHVINYDFPARPKLFVHRVGRVARAGRSGTAHSLVSPDELAYMLDVHLFMGWQPKHAVPEGDEYNERDVHYGRLPSDALSVFSEFVLNALNSNSDLQALHRVTLNAYKQYHRTRVAPSPESVKRAKQLPQDALHPILAHKGLVATDQMQAVDFVASLKRFRPPQTVLEMQHNDVGSRRRVSTGLGAVDVMKQKRAHHDELIQKRNEIPPPGEKSERQSLDKEEEELLAEQPQSKKQKREAGSYRDEEYFLPMFQKGRAKEDALAVTEGLAGDVALDLMSDDKEAMAKNKNQMRWDRKRKRFVSAASLEAKNKKGGFKFKNEAGAKVDAKGKKISIYKKWSERTRTHIPVVGEDEGSIKPVPIDQKTLYKYRHKAPNRTTTGTKPELKGKDQIKKEKKRMKKLQAKMKHGRSVNYMKKKK